MHSHRQVICKIILSPPSEISALRDVQACLHLEDSHHPHAKKLRMKKKSSLMSHGAATPVTGRCCGSLKLLQKQVISQ